MTSEEQCKDSQKKFEGWAKGELSRVLDDAVKSTGRQPDDTSWAFMQTTVAHMLERGWDDNTVYWAGCLLRQLGNGKPVCPITEKDFDDNGHCARWPSLVRTLETGKPVYTDKDAIWHVDYHIRERGAGRTLESGSEIVFAFVPDAIHDELKNMFPIELPYSVPFKWPQLIGEVDMQYAGSMPPYTLRISHVIKPDGGVEAVDWTWVDYDGSGFARVSKDAYDKAVAAKEEQVACRRSEK